jgi:hypothetical protein
MHIMNKPAIRIAIILLIGALAASCSQPGSSVSSNSQDATVNTIVAVTLEAPNAATPVPSQTPEPSITPTSPLPVLPGWVRYTDERYGIQLDHPNLFYCKCGLAAFINLGDISNVTTLAVESTLTNSGAPFDGLSVDVFLNPDAVSLQEFVEEEKQAILAGPGLIGGTLEEAPFTAGGQTGLSMQLSGNISRAIYIPFPSSNKILIVSVGNHDDGSFEATADQILSTLKFTH